MSSTTSNSYWKAMISFIKETATYPWNAAVPGPNATSYATHSNLEKLAFWSKDLDSVKNFVDVCRPIEAIFIRLFGSDSHFTAAYFDEAYKRLKAAHQLAWALLTESCDSPEDRDDFEGKVARLLKMEKDATMHSMGLSEAHWEWIVLFVKDWKSEDDVVESLAAAKPDDVLDDAKSLDTDNSDSEASQDGNSRNETAKSLQTGATFTLDRSLGTD